MRTTQLLQPGDLDWCRTARGTGWRASRACRRPDCSTAAGYRATAYEVIRQGGGGTPVTLVCGAVSFDHPAAHNLVQVLPKMIRVEASNPPQMEWIRARALHGRPRPGIAARRRDGRSPALPTCW